METKYFEVFVSRTVTDIVPVMATNEEEARAKVQAIMDAGNSYEVNSHSETQSEEVVEACEVMENDISKAVVRDNEETYKESIESN